MFRKIYTLLRVCLLLMSVGTTSAFAQDITGIWRGYFITEGFEHYKFELQVKQTGNTVSGVSYSYLSTVFYGKATLTGSFNKAGQSALIREIKTVELKMSGSSQACIMKCIFKYEKSGREEFLEGTFTSQFEKDGLMTKKGGNCGGGKVFLRKVTTSDFYIEPFLRGKIKSQPVIVNQPPIKKDTAKAKPVVKPPVNKPVTKPANPPVTKPNNPPVNKPVTKVTTPPVVKKDSVKITKVPVAIPTPPALKNRSNELVKTITVTSPEVTVKLFDNGEIDGDTISVYLNKKLVLSSKRLTASPLQIKFTIEESDMDYELVMVAENLGKIPPNTSLMIVESAGQRFEARITSTEQKNAVVKFRYRKE
jgi:hypothetical protein